MRFVYFLLPFVASLAVCLDFDSCDEGDKIPNSVNVFGCSNQPCTFNIGSNVTGAVNITVEEESTDLEGEMTVDHNGSLIIFPVPGVHICSGLPADECHYEDGTIANFYFLFNVAVDVPKVDAVLFSMKIRNQNGTLLSCFKFKGKLTGEIADEDEK